MSDKKRGCNFTQSEKVFVFRLIAEKCAIILEDKKRIVLHYKNGRKLGNSLKRSLVVRVSPASIYREPSNLKKLYANKKKTFGKKLDKEKKEIFLTGGGPPAIIQKYDDEIDTILLPIVNEKNNYGLHNPSDNDSTNLTQTMTRTSSELANIEYVFENEKEHLCTESLYKEKEQPQIEAEVNAGPSWKRYIPNDLTKAKNSALVSKERKLSDNASKTLSRRRPTTSVKTLTSSIVAQKYDLLLDKRLVLVEKQIKQTDNEHELNLRKKNLEIESLQLDIALKKKQLGLM